MKSTKRSLLTSGAALLLCFVMLIGTTFAWFTDEATSANNVIKAGNLDIGMHWSKDNTNWKDAEGTLAEPVFNYDKWEPGYTEVRYIKVTNNGSLSFKYEMFINPTGTVGKLAEVIDVSYDIVTGNTNFKAPASKYDMGSLTKVGTLNNLIASDKAIAGGVLLPNGVTEDGYYTGEIVVCVAFHMQELAGNEYQGTSIGDSFGINLYATQFDYENDSYDNTYDDDAEWPFKPIKHSVSETISDKITVDANTGTPSVNEEVTVGETTDDIYAEIPAGVTLAPGADSLVLNVETMEAPTVSIPLEGSDTARSIDVHIEGVSENNTVPMLVTLKKLFNRGLNTTSVKLYHVEDGVPVEMTLVTNPTNHNEFSYDPATGDVVMCVASFSEYVTVEDDWNRWEGEYDTSWYDNWTATPDDANLPSLEVVDGVEKKVYYINNADQLAGLGAIVDGGYKKPDNTTVTIKQHSFENAIVKLNSDIDLGGTVSFNPIGFGYDYAGYNTNSAAGCVFKGTFDGQGYTISNLYVNGWDIGISYSNSGGGLFASVCDATIKNLTMKNADIVMECVEQGVIAGLAQGSCTFDNINIYGCSVANYQRATGGVVGEVSPKYNSDKTPDTNNEQTHRFQNINIDSTTVVGSLWGDFDAPVGGVIGAKWDDGKGITNVVMENVSVACRLDVYNDVTSTYQWYAYRRAGMLIGNTEDTKTENGRTVAAADFLTCTNVTVYYGNWTKYHYCEFSDYNSSWPYVRVEAGENCTAFSNPRWGVPELNGVKVTPENHPITEQTTHANGDDCMVELKFGQLYGGGQGVYGDPTHENVNTVNYAYSIQYINDDKLLAETFVESNTSEFTLISDSNYETAKAKAEEWVKSKNYTNVEFGGWENAGSTKVTAIAAGNTENIKLYPSFNSPYTARFVDQNGNVLAWCLFHSENTDELESTRLLAESKLVFDEGFSLYTWEVHITDDNGNLITEEDYSVDKFAGYTTDVTVYPEYKFNGDVKLIPVDSDGDGDTDYYQVGGYGEDTGEQELVEIPGVVNGIPVTTINADAFSSYDDLHSVRIPGTITEINSQSFTKNQGSSWNPKRDTVTLYYEGDPAKWAEAMNKYNNDDYSGMLKQNWDNNMGDGSRVFFLVNGKVDNTKYWELNDDFIWVLHEHAYTYEAAKGCGLGEKSHYEYGGGIFGLGGSLQEDEFTNYSGTCDCNSCGGATRPDAEYWTPVATTSTEE